MSDIGKLICLEGPEGAGKSTQLARLEAELGPSGRFVFVREPGGTDFGESVRKLIFPHLSEISVSTQLLLFMASRLHVFEHVVRPALLRGQHVVMDRMDASTYAYQVFRSESVELDQVFNLLRRIYLSPIGKSDWIHPHYVFLAVQPSIGLKRKLESKGEINAFDTMDISFHESVYAGYQHFIPLQRNRHLIYANYDQDTVYDALLRTIHEITVS